MTRLTAFASLICLGLALPAAAAPDQAASAKALLMTGVGFDTVKGRGKVPAYASYLKAQLVAGGFAVSDITIEPVGETAILHLVWKGVGRKPPMAIAGHMDVVEADPKDWVRDPFTAIEEGDYIFGRGVDDNKFDVSMIISTLIGLKSEGFKPGRDIHLFLSGDEETANSAAIQAKQAKAAGVDFLLNGDAGGGVLDTAGAAQSYGLSAAEKDFMDYSVTVTDPGGHSSRPTATNAIATLARATDRIFAYHFAPQINEITRGSLIARADRVGGPVGAAMAAFAANPADAAAIAILRAEPGVVGQIGTTCAPTLVSGGHADNALPQRAVLNVNCRIFPGVSAESVRAELEKVVADPAAKVTIPQPWPSAGASPLRADITAAVNKALAATRPGLTATPAMDAGASDSVYYRQLGIPSYGVSGLFIKEADVFIHGLNERVPVSAIAPALRHWHVLITSLAK